MTGTSESMGVCVGGRSQDGTHIPNVRRTDVVSAANRLNHRIRHTPILRLVGAEGTPRVALKLESLQVSGSFKIRGATNRLLLDNGRHAGVAAVSGGNHGLAVALASRNLRLKADIFLPSCSPDHKLRQIRAAGANLHVVDGPFAEAASRCADFVAANDALLVHPFEDPAVIAGQGTLGLEILEQSPDVTKVIVAVGGGGLAAGIVIALDGGAEVIAVEPKACPSLAEALRAGMPVAAPVGGIAADSLGAPVIGEVAFSVLAPSVRHAVTLSEKAILDAQQQLWQEFRLAVEPAAACSWAVLESTEVSFAADDCIVVVICGGNVNPQEMAAWASS